MVPVAVGAEVVVVIYKLLGGYVGLEDRSTFQATTAPTACMDSLGPRGKADHEVAASPSLGTPAGGGGGDARLWRGLPAAFLDGGYPHLDGPRGDAPRAGLRFGHAPGVVQLRAPWRGALAHRRGHRPLPSPG